MKELILILGGARSGKSSFAVELAKKLSNRVVFIATAISLDEEMKNRIKTHKASRSRHWKLIEEGKNVASVLAKLKGKYEVVLIDCLGLLISNFLADNLKDKEIVIKIKKLISAILKLKFTIILVSNEVGSGIVPDNLLARRFRDLLGLANQMIAKKASQVILMLSGTPITIKGGKKDAEVKRDN